MHTRDFGLTLRGSTLDGTYRGILFGLIFFKSFRSLAEGTANEAITGRITYYENPGSFTKSRYEKITESASTNLQIAGESTTDKVVDAFNQLPWFELNSINLSNEQEKLFRQTFTSSKKHTNRGYY